MVEVGHLLTVGGWFLAPVCSGLWVALRDQRRKAAEAREAATEEAEEERKWQRRMNKAVLRRDLVDAYEKHVVDGRPLTVERRHEITEEYEAYAHYGGNGTGRHMYEAICELPVEIVK